jgi:hypothetical protein
MQATRKNKGSICSSNRSHIICVFVRSIKTKVCLGRHERQYLLPMLVSVHDLEKPDPATLPSAFATVGIVKFNWQMSHIVDHCRMQETRTTTDI